MMRKLLLITLGLAMSTQLFAQTRYVDEVFSDVTVMQDVQYAVNISVIANFPPGIVDTLELDLYMPAGDTATDRPLVLFCHTGNFLPPVFNGGPYGDKRDSVNVELCTRLAKMGYVAASFNYRLGWNPSPLATDDERRSTILQAAYRGIQDAKTCIRFFRKTVAEDGNPYGLNGDDVALGGVGTGGYVSLGATFLDQQTELFLPKFINTQTQLPYVVPSIFGNFEGSDSTYLPTGPTDSVLFNIGNYAGYSSEFSVAFHLGGALGDSSWIDGGEVPLISFHSPQDSFAPYNIGNVIVPTTGDIVIPTAAGGGTILPKVNALGNQDVFINAGFNDPFTTAANADNGGNEGLFPLIVAPAGAGVQCDPDGAITAGGANSSPWNWFSEAWFAGAWDFIGGQPGSPLTGAEAVCANTVGFPNDAANARMYMDSIAGYLAPRMNVVFEANNVGIADDLLRQDLVVFPNPARELMTIRSKSGQAIQSAQLMDLSGRIVRDINPSRGDMQIERGELAAGIYVLQVRSRTAATTVKVRFD